MSQHGSPLQCSTLYVQGSFITILVTNIGTTDINITYKKDFYYKKNIQFSYVQFISCCTIEWSHCLLLKECFILWTFKVKLCWHHIILEKACFIRFSFSVKPFTCELEPWDTCCVGAGVADCCRCCWLPPTNCCDCWMTPNCCWEPLPTIWGTYNSFDHQYWIRINPTDVRTKIT